MSSNLLPVGSSSCIPAKFQRYNIDDVLTASVSCEYDKELYICSLLHNNLYRFQKINMLTNKLTTLFDISNTLIGTYWQADMLVDDDYIYFLTSETNTSTSTTNNFIYKISLSSAVVTKVRTKYPLSGMCRRMYWYDKPNSFIMCDINGVTIYDIKSNTFTSYASGYSNATHGDFCLGKTKVLIADNTSTSTIRCIDLVTNTASVITLTETAYISITYNDNKFYVVSKNIITVINESDLLTNVITTSWGINVNIACYDTNTIYASVRNSNKVCTFDITNNYPGIMYMPWTAAIGYDYIRATPITYDGYFIFPYITLCIANTSLYTKYKFGYKYDQMVIAYNSDAASSYVYDQNVIKFTDAYMTMNDTSITINTTIDPVNPLIKHASVDKALYNIIKNVKFK